MKLAARLGMALALTLGSASAYGQQPALQRTDHSVSVKSTAPGMKAQEARLYVREVRADTAGPFKGVVLFVHGAGTPAETAFDPNYGDYSWMAYLARAGFDVFAMDMEGYGRSSRPPVMDSPCNAPAATRAQLAPAATAACGPAVFGPITTMASDWNDIGAVVDRLLAMRGVSKLSIVAWSQGGPRSFGYTLANPGKVERLAVLAPAYNREMRDGPPDAFAPDYAPYGTQTKAEFIANWDRQAPCGGYDPGVRDAVWADMLASDPVGAKWGPGMRRAPTVPSWGFNKAAAAKMTTPYLMVTGAADKQVLPARVFELFEDLGSQDKVLIDLACSSHNAMWEPNRLLLYKASLDWLTTGKIGGASRGIVKMGY